MPLTLTSSLCPDEEMLLPLSSAFDDELPLSPSSPSLYDCHTPATTPVESRCGTPGWSTPHTYLVNIPGATPASSLTCTPSPSLPGSPSSTGFPSQSVGSLSPISQSGAGDFSPVRQFDRSVSPAQPSTSTCTTPPHISSSRNNSEAAAKLPRHKRKSHIRAEHKRRFKIQVRIVTSICKMLKKLFRSTHLQNCFKKFFSVNAFFQWNEVNLRNRQALIFSIRISDLKYNCWGKFILIKRIECWCILMWHSLVIFILSPEWLRHCQGPCSRHRQFSSQQQRQQISGAEEK